MRWLARVCWIGALAGWASTLPALGKKADRSNKDSGRKLQFGGLGGLGYAAGAGMVNSGYRAAQTAGEIRSHCQAKKSREHKQRKLQGLLIGAAVGASVAGAQIAANEGRRYVHNNMDSFCIEEMSGIDASGGNLEMAGAFPQDAAVLAALDAHHQGRKLQATSAGGATAWDQGGKAASTMSAQDISDYCKAQKEHKRALSATTMASTVGSAVAGAQISSMQARQYVGQATKDGIFCRDEEEGVEVMWGGHDDDGMEYPQPPVAFDLDIAAKRKAQSNRAGRV